MQKAFSFLSLFTVILCCSLSGYGQQNSLLFDGVDDKVVIPDNAAFDVTSELTVEAWINATQWKPQSYQGTIIGKDGPTTTGFVLRCGENGKLSFTVGTGSGGWVEVKSASVMQAGSWAHVAGVFDNGDLSIYINGTLAGTTSTANLISTNTLNLYLGESTGFSGRFFQGYIDEVRIWNVVRSQAQIAANSLIDLPNTEPGLVAYYKFNQTTGTTTPNEIAATTNTLGTLTNFPANPWSAGYTPPGTDIGAVSVSSPDVITFFSGASRIKTMIKNYGVDTVKSFSIGYILNSDPAVIESVPDTLLPNQEFSYSFHSVVEGINNTNDLKIFTVLPGDNNSINDTLRFSINKPTGGIYTVPLFESKRHNYGAFGQTQTMNIALPDNNLRFKQILMNISLTCPTTGCDPWDQPAKISLIKNGVTYELARFITPYGKGCGPWVVDVTNFKSILQGACNFESYIQVWGSSGWLLNTSLTFIEGNTLHPYQKLTRLWETDNFVYGDPGISYDLPVQSLATNSLTNELEMRITNSGHGQANTDNAAEFSNKTHVVVVNGSNYVSHNLWKPNCSSNTCNNQSGTWTYARAGWCPGQAVDPYFVNLSPQLVPGQTITVDYVLQSYTNLLNTGYNGGSHTEPHYKIHAFLIEKSDKFIDGPSFVNAAAMRISYPLTNADLSSNTFVKVWLRNAGTTTITNPEVYYFVNGVKKAQETAPVVLNAGDSVEY
jgi:hypothetical protein